MPLKPSREVIAENIRKYRRLRGLTQQTLARKISIAINKDYAHSRIAEIESGKHGITSDVLDRLADALEVPPSVLLIPVEQLQEAIA